MYCSNVFLEGYTHLSNLHTEVESCSYFLLAALFSAVLSLKVSVNLLQSTLQITSCKRSMTAAKVQLCMHITLCKGFCFASVCGSSSSPSHYSELQSLT